MGLSQMLTVISICVSEILAGIQFGGQTATICVFSNKCTECVIARWGNGCEVRWLCKERISTVHENRSVALW